MWSKARPRAFVPLARLERDLQPAVALTAPTGMLTATHTSLPARVRDLAARVHTACHVSCLRLLCSCLYWSVARLRARPTARVYRAGPPAPAPFSPATDSGRLEKSPTNSPTTDELGSSGPALLCRARALVASHVLATCATVHITPLILSLRAWGGRVGDSQSDGGGQRSCCIFRPLAAAASLRGGLQPHYRTTQPTLNPAHSWPAPLRDD